ncbi:MAG: hypothetical protein ACOZNI_24995 [Myxococcota bacterium]
MLLVAAALASTPPEAEAAEVRPSPVEDDGFTFLGVVGARASTSNVATTNPLLNGQLVGELGGVNTTVTGEDPAPGAEMRVGGFFRYTPPLLDGRAALDAAFEVDFGFGDTSYSIGGNTGGAFGGDQVNLQTRRLAVRLRPWAPLTVVAGLQFVSDGVHDPGAARLDDLFRGGGRLMFFGSEAAGVTAFYARDVVKARLGLYTLYELSLVEDDDVALMMADVQVSPAHAWRVGAHGWWLRDRAGGAAGLLGEGVTSTLSEMQGGPRLDMRPTEDAAAPAVGADLVWVGADVGYNPALDMGDLGATALVITNQGKLYVADLDDWFVSGWLADAELRWRYTQGEGSVARVELLASSADRDDTFRYSGVVTGNSYGIVGAVHGTHGCLLLFPDPRAINRQVAVVYDVSGGGDGLVAATASVGWDVVPDRLTVGVGGGHARSAAGEPRGTEVNARIVGEPFVLGEVGLYAATVTGTALAEDPWTVFLAFDWLVI